MYLDHPFNVSTGTSRRPTPTEFEYLRQAVEVDEKYQEITSAEQLTEYTQILEQQATLYISNVIQQVIAQIIGLSGSDWITIKSTLDGALHVSVRDDLASRQTLEKAEIDFLDAGDHIIIYATNGKKTRITSLVFTVGGETNLTLKTADEEISGPMDFGGANEPRGMVIPHGIFSLPCGVGEDFKINSSAAVQVSGYAVYYKE